MDEFFDVFDAQARDGTGGTVPVLRLTAKERKFRAPDKDLIGRFQNVIRDLHDPSRRILLDLSSIVVLSSAPLGSIITLHKTTKLRLCGLRAELADDLAVMKLDTFFCIFADAAKALEAEW